MKPLRGLAAILVAVTLAACGGQPATETVTRTTTTAAAAAATAKKAYRNSTAATKPKKASGSWATCDANIEARRPSTSCGFAQNAFYEYWMSDYATSLRVYSPALQASLVTTCRKGSSFVTCRTGDGGRARFRVGALDEYSTNQASSYAATHDIGVDSTSAFSAASGDSGGASAVDSEPSDEGEFPPFDERIPNFDEGTGSVVQCADGMYSQSGGRPGACSGHGGVG